MATKNRARAQVEALHVWRNCTEHNIDLMHLDDAFPSICRLFDCPPTSSSPASRQGSAASRGHVTSQGSPRAVSHASSAQLSKAEQLLQKVQMRGSCQAFLLLGSLVRHANRCSPASLHIPRRRLGPSPIPLETLSAVPSPPCASPIAPTAGHWAPAMLLSSFFAMKQYSACWKLGPVCWLP